MKFTPNRPSFLNARDGILQADQNLNGGANRCAIWTVFARHGMGVSAVGNDGTTHTAATNVPADCGGTCTFSISPTSASYRGGGRNGQRHGDCRRGLRLDRGQQRNLHHDHFRQQRFRQRHGQLFRRRQHRQRLAQRHDDHRRPNLHGYAGGHRRRWHELIVNPGFETRHDAVGN